MTIKTKNSIKRVTSGLCVTALIGALSACSGSGSPAAPATGGNNGGGDNGGPTIDPCLGVGIPKPNVLFPTHPDIEYKYINNEGQENILGYKCAQTVKNGTRSTALYPLNYKTNFTFKENADAAEKQVSFTVVELVSSNQSSVILHGYKIRDIPLGVVLPDTTDKINVDILPTNPLTIFNNNFVLNAENQHNYGATKLRFTDMSDDEIRSILNDVVKFLKEKEVIEKNNAALDLLIGGGITAAIAAYRNTDGLPVNATGYSKLLKDGEPITWGPNTKAANVQVIEQVMNFSINSTDFGLDLLNVKFDLNIKVTNVLELAPNIGPVLRSYKVETTQNSTPAQSEEKATVAATEESEQQTEGGNTAIDIPTFEIILKLNSITGGDTDNDDILDVVDTNVGNVDTETAKQATP